MSSVFKVGTTSVWRTLCPPGVTLVWRTCWSGKGLAYCCAVCWYVCIAVVYVLLYVYVCSVPVCVCGPMCVYVQFLLCFSLFLVIFLVFRRMTRHFIGFSEVPFS